MNRTRTLAITNTAVFIVANLISYLSNTGFFAGKTIGDVSDNYDALVVPAGFTFAVWGLIYASLYAFVIYHLRQAFSKDETHEANCDLNKTGWLFTVNNAATALWVIAWINELLIVSVVLMIIQLFTLTAINVRLDIYTTGRSRLSTAFTQFPLSIYFAWICIATIANISSVLVGQNWDGGVLLPQTWAILLIVVALLLASFIILLKRNVFFGMVVVWALYGIIKKQQPTALSENLINTAWAAILALVILIVLQLIRNSKAPRGGLEV